MGNFLLMSMIPGMLAPPHPAPPRGKTGCPVPPRPAKSRPCPAPPRPVKLTKPAGRNGAKLTVDYTDYAHTFGLRVGK